MAGTLGDAPKRGAPTNVSGAPAPGSVDACELDADAIDRLITSDERYQEQLAHRRARVSKGE